MKTLAIIGAAITLFVSTPAFAGTPECDAAGAALEAAQEAVDARKATEAELASVEQAIPYYRNLIAEEKANPSGVVDLRRLHDYGEMLQSALKERPILVHNLAVLKAEQAKKLAAAAKGVAACKASRGVS